MILLDDPNQGEPPPVQRWHLIEGEAGCAYAVAHGCVAIIVDALRASATATMLLHHGATEILMVREVEEARAAKVAWPDALLFGERGGLPPEGFDFGNSPRETAAAAGHRVIFTSTTGAGRLVAAWGARAVYMGTTVNASAVVRAAAQHECEVVVIPAGLTGDPAFDAQEDRVAAAYLAMLAKAEIVEGRGLFDQWKPRIEAEGLDALFASSPHAEKLRGIGLGADISYCARADLSTAVPRAIERTESGVLVRI